MCEMRVRGSVGTIRPRAALGLLVVSCMVVLVTSVSGQVTVLTDFLDMESGNSGDLVSPAIATAATYGTGGTWTLGDYYSSAVPHQLKVSTKYVRPPRGPVQVGSTIYSDAGSSRSWVKKITVETDVETVDYRFPSPRPDKVSVGMFFYFSGDGDSWPGNTGDYYDLFWLQAYSGEFVSFNVQTSGGTDPAGPMRFTIETSGCVSSIEVCKGKVNQWYWLAFLWDGPGNRGTMQVYNADTWAQVGTAKSCSLTTTAPLWRIAVGQRDNHNNPTLNSDYYMDDLMIDRTGATFPLLPRPTSGAPKPAAPQNLRLLP